MKKLTILLDTISKINDFIQVMAVEDAEVELHSGKYVVDAKSILGIFSLDLSTPIEVICNEGFSDSTLTALKKFKAV